MQQSYAPLFAEVQAAMARRLGRPVKFELIFFKNTRSEITLAGQVDFMIMETTSYVEAHHLDSKLPRLRSSIAGLTAPS